MLLCDNFVFLYANFISMATTSVSRKLKELDNLREDIKAAAGLKDKTLSPNDFDFIETDIKKKLPKSYINAKTLKRLFGYDKTGESSYIRLYTLDVLSQYVGCDNWNDYLERVRLWGEAVRVTSLATKSTQMTCILVTPCKSNGSLTEKAR